MPDATPDLFQDSGFRFGPDFMRDHAGHIILDPRIALVELVANAYDAGATTVNIAWPDQLGDTFSIEDDGLGMTREQFDRRWKTLSYKRTQEQGDTVLFPDDVRAAKCVPMAFGQSGKGRHGAFCFADSYKVESRRDGQCLNAVVELRQEGNEPFHCVVQEVREAKGHGTRIEAAITRHLIDVDEVRQAVGSKFLVAPWFHVKVNGQTIALTDVSGLTTSTLAIDGYGEVRVHKLDGMTQDRTTRLRGITWWVGRKMVGQPSWHGLDDRGAVLDGRTQLAKRCSFIVEADFLKPDVKGDWEGFHDTPRTIETVKTVRTYVTRTLDDLLMSVRRDKKRSALAENRGALAPLPSRSKSMVGTFVDEIIRSCPTLAEGDLVRVVSILAKLENARSGHDILVQLARCNPDDIDTWNGIMSTWTAKAAETVLDELGQRLALIAELQALVGRVHSDELHELQPLFAQGLWMFGPEYEAIEFTSNRAMTTVLRQMFNLDPGDGTDLARRPDFIVLPDRSIGTYSSLKYDVEGEVEGFSKILVVELKKGGSTVGVNEMRQGEDYALKLREKLSLRDDVHIMVHVLGSNRDAAAKDDRTAGEYVRVRATTYEVLLRRAHARTFNLQRKIEASAPQTPTDDDVDAILADTLI